MAKIILGNLKLLKKDMEDKGWQIDSFLFNYNQQDYIVLVKLYATDEKKPEYALLKVEFLRRGNIDANLEVPANTAKLMTDAQTLREYFNIHYTENLGNLLQEFTEHFGRFIPKEVCNNKNEIQKRAMVISLSMSDTENTNKRYCYKVKRNPDRADKTLGQRTPYNDNKTRLLRPTLYQKLGEDTNLSFCYSENPDDENPDETIILNWTKNKEK